MWLIFLYGNKFFFLSQTLVPNSDDSVLLYFFETFYLFLLYMKFTCRLLTGLVHGPPSTFPLIWTTGWHVMRTSDIRREPKSKVNDNVNGRPVLCNCLTPPPSHPFIVDLFVRDKPTVVRGHTVSIYSLSIVTSYHIVTTSINLFS